MADISTTNGDILAGAKAAQYARTTDALVSVKLSRLRRALSSEIGSIVPVFHEICERYSEKDAAGISVPDKDGTGVQKVWATTNTPAVVILPEHTSAHAAEIAALLAGSVTLAVIPLTERDLAAITIPEQYTALVGDGLAPFTTIAAPEIAAPETAATP